MSELIDIDLTPEQQEEMIEMYISQIMTPEALETFNDKRNIDIKQALFDAVINECIIILVKQQVEMEKADDAAEE